MRSRCFRFVLLLGMSAIFAVAQYTSQRIAGFVRDPSGSAVPNVPVSVRNVATGQVRTAPTNENGRYVIGPLAIGEYEVLVEAPGFKKFVQKQVAVTVNETTTVDISLEVGDAADSITVSADAVQVESNSGEIGRLVTGTQAAKLQLNGRNFAQLLSLLPGVSTTYSSGFSLYGSYGSVMNGQSINGSRAEDNGFSWNINGIDNKDNGGGGNNFVNINPDAIAEFKVLTANYSAEYGQNSGAVVNLALKSGTRDFHGMAYEYIRNDAFDARAYNALSKQKLRFNNFGWNLGGPIYIPRTFNNDKSKFFFFVGQEFKRLSRGAISTWNVPPLAIRGGDFSSLPISQWPADPLTHTTFPNGVIPASRISSNGKRLVDNYPKPNFSGTGGNFVLPAPAPLDTDQYFVKFDYNINSQHQLSVHYVHDAFYSLKGATELVTYERHIPGTNSSATWTYVINPTTVNTFQFGLPGNAIHHNNFLPNPLFITDFTRRGQGIMYPMLYGAAGGIPSISVSGYHGLSAETNGWQNYQRLFQFKNDFSKVIGNHNIKTGILVLRSRKNEETVPALNGEFTFRPGHANSSGNAYADALLGNFFDYTEAERSLEGWYRFTQAEVYVQDNWKLTPRLSLDVGVRYQYMQPQYDVMQTAVTFSSRYYDRKKAMVVVPESGQIVPGSGDPYNGLALGGTDFPEAAKQRIPRLNDPAIHALFRGLPKEITGTDHGTIGPRLGFAYDLSGRQQTVIRGGAGLFFSRIEGNYVIGRQNNPPFIRQSTVYDANIEDPSRGSEQPDASPLSTYATNLRIPRVANWSMGVQQKLSRDTVLDVAYVGAGSWHQYRHVNLNQLPVGTTFKYPDVNINALRPYLGYSDIAQYTTGSNFNYNSLQVMVKKQMSSGGLLTAAYTWSKSIGDVDDYDTFPMDSYNISRDRSLAGYNRQQVLVFSYVYPLPFFQAQRQWYERVLGGWQISGLTTLQSGLPLNISIEPDQAGIGGGEQRPDVTGDVRSGGGSRNRWFNTSAFALPQPGTFGSLGRNVVIGPGTNNWDVSLQKQFTLTEHGRVEFRTEFYNAPHHFSYTGVATTFGSSNFGQVTSANDPRTLQFAVKFMF